MALVIKSNVKQIQNQYVKSITKYFMTKDYPYGYDDARTVAVKIYKKMITALNNLVHSISDRYSQFPGFYKGYPILTFQSSKGNSTWYFAYMRNKNTGNVIVFDMRNVNTGMGKTFINSNRYLNQKLIKHYVRNAIIEMIAEWDDQISKQNILYQF